MRVFFMGTPQLAVPTLRRIIESKHEVILVVTQPDKRAGRQQRIGSPPVKLAALEEGIPVAQPLTLKDEEFRAKIEELKTDVGVVFAYGKIIPQWLLDLPAHGIINIHPSLLPKWRGAAPIQRPIIAGDTITGVTIMQMVAALDAGDILLQKEVVIGPEDTSETLGLKLSDVAADLIVEALDRLENGTISFTKQDESQVIYAEKITDDDVEVVWDRPAEVIRNQVRGLNPKPGAHTHLDDMLLKIWSVEPSPDVVIELEQATPGMIVKADKKKGPYVATTTEPLLLTEVQPANKKKMSGAEFVRGYRLKAGDKLGLVDSKK